MVYLISNTYILTLQREVWTDLQCYYQPVSAAISPPHNQCGSHFHDVNSVLWVDQRLSAACTVTAVTQTQTQWWVSSLFGLVFSLSEIATCTHRPQGVIIVDIYMSSNIYYLLLLLCSSRKELCRQISLQTSNRDIFVKFHV